MDETQFLWLTWFQEKNYGAYCCNRYTVNQGQPSYIPTFNFDCNFGYFVRGRNTQQKQKKWSDTACWGENYSEKQLPYMRHYNLLLIINRGF